MYVWVYCICVYCMCVYCMCVYCMCVCSYHCRLNGIYMHAFVLAACKMKIYAHLMVAFGLPPLCPPLPHAHISCWMHSLSRKPQELLHCPTSLALPSSPSLSLPLPVCFSLTCKWIIFYFISTVSLAYSPLPSLSLSLYIYLLSYVLYVALPVFFCGLSHFNMQNSWQESWWWMLALNEVEISVYFCPLPLPHLLLLVFCTCSFLWVQFWFSFLLSSNWLSFGLYRGSNYASFDAPCAFCVKSD